MWIIISITNWRFHQALEAQNDPLFTEVYAWRAWKWPVPPVHLMLVSGLLLACCLAISIKPLVSSLRPSQNSLQTNSVVVYDTRLILCLWQGDAPFSVYGFFQYNLGLLMIVGCTLLYKVIMRTKLVDPRTADLVHGRRTLSVEEIKELDAYYGMSRWRRFLTYVQLW